jgi:hypothetical protein
MVLIGNVEGWFWRIILAHWWQAMPNFCTTIGWKFDYHQQILTKTDPICKHKKTSVASRPLNILHMGLICDVEGWCWLLLAHRWQAMPNFCTTVRWKFDYHPSKSEPKMTPFVVMKPHQLPPDHWISSIWVILVMLRSDAGSFWPIDDRPCQTFAQQLAESLTIIPANLNQNWTHLWSGNHISCLQTTEYPPYGSY